MQEGRLAPAFPSRRGQHIPCALWSPCAAVVVSQCPQRFLSSPSALLIRVSVAPSCCAHVGRDGSGCWGWQGFAGLCSPRAILWPLWYFWVVSVSQPAGPVTSSVCPAAALLVLSPWSHLLMTFPLSPLVIISPETPQPGLSSLFPLSFCIFREKVLNVMCCSQTAALVSSPPVGP